MNRAESGIGIIGPGRLIPGRDHPEDISYYDDIDEGKSMMMGYLKPVLIGLLVWAMSGCQGGGGYRLEGKVVTGGYSMMEFVPADDPRLQERGIGNVKLVIHRDGNKSWPKWVADGTSAPSGMINIPINEFGAGWMIEQWLIEAFKPGYVTLNSIMTLPSQKSGRKLLIMMAPGQAQPLRPRNELLDQYDRFR